MGGHRNVSLPSPRRHIDILDMCVKSVDVPLPLFKDLGPFFRDLSTDGLDGP